MAALPKLSSMGYLVVSVVLLLLQDVRRAHAALQTFEQPPSYTEVNPDSDVKLVCKIYNKRGNCSWQKDNKPVGMYPKKYEWAGSQEQGDCSIWIRNATLNFDDGLWECQVTASEFTTGDALTSPPAKLVVRVAPQTPRIEFNGSHVLPGRNVSVRVGSSAVVKCISRFGNPPANIRWLLGSEDITSQANQTNATEEDNHRLYVATSYVRIASVRDLHRQPLRCVAMHESHSTKSQDAEVKLDVHYPPEVSLSGTPTSDLEENVDRVLLACKADANPPAAVFWEATDRGNELVSSQETLQFLPVTRKNAGRYTCRAKNEVGFSPPVTVYLDVKYAPRVVAIEPRVRTTTVKLGSSVSFNCTAEGNPEPSYQWLQKMPTTQDTVIIRGSQAELVMHNVTYEHQGEYVCKVTNLIGGTERSEQSESLSVQVKGAPQVLRNAVAREVSVLRGQDAHLKMVVCADPKPSKVQWHWGSLAVDSGANSGRFQAEELLQEEREDCYEARLHVRSADLVDARTYHLTVENDRGADSHMVLLAVREPVSMTTLLSVASGCLLLLLLLVLLSVYAVRREKCCFAIGRGDFRPADLERLDRAKAKRLDNLDYDISEKSDVDSTSGKKTPRIDGSLGNNAVVGIGPDHHYGHQSPIPVHHRIPQHITAGGSPEAMKHPERASTTERRRRKSSGSSHRHRDRPGHRHEPKQQQDYHEYQQQPHQQGYQQGYQRVLPSNSGAAARLSMLNSMNLQHSSASPQGSPPAQAYFLPSTHSMGFNDLAHAYFQPNSYERAEI
ncbi:irregular chiasm C-roughest protein isoform X3 [Thrips palmi]|uniref:Irregular chiasm C-roughest protein isoform X3 n=1 Tax=Thrips palmi TaxID=161013 RepID=A0A6P8ZH33_THRPL|nr:irregular chiasm C-roughest protein isoform X3 [Thrips palmi]